MDDWQPENPALLEFDLNECTPREFCEVFGMEPAVAHNLQEYRAEILHIFKFEQLLKLKGFSEENIQLWSDPKPDNAFDRELQHLLNLQTDSAEPLPNLIEGAARQTGASVCLMARYGGILIPPAPENPESKFPATEVPEFVRSVQEDMFQMNLGRAHAQVIGFDSHDLLFLPASAFYLAAAQPRENLSSALLKLLRALAEEIRRRLPPKICINNYAPVTENDVLFNCPKCNLRLVVNRSGVGYTFPCPRCKNSVTIPGDPDSP